MPTKADGRSPPATSCRLWKVDLAMFWSVFLKKKKKSFYCEDYLKITFAWKPRSGGCIKKRKIILNINTKALLCVNEQKNVSATETCVIIAYVYSAFRPFHLPWWKLESFWMCNMNAYHSATPDVRSVCGSITLEAKYLNVCILNLLRNEIFHVNV